MTNEDRDKLLIEIKTTLGQLDENLKGMRKAIYGNGHDGLIQDVSKLITRTEHIEKESADTHKTLRNQYDNLEHRITSLESQKKGVSTTLAALGSLIAAISSFVTLAFALLSKAK